MVAIPAGAGAQGSLRVMILSANPETADGLQAYLLGAGLPSQCIRDLRDLERPVSAPPAALVVFPDDFGHVEVLRVLRRLRRARPHALVLLVTREPQHFRGAVDADRGSRPPILLARPCFGWDILDVIRTHSPSASL